MQIITSKDNEKIKEIRKLKETKYREEKKQYLVEGIRLLEEAIREKADIDTIVICEDCLRQEILEAKIMYEIAKYNCIYVSEKVFLALTEVTNPQGVLAVINKNQKINRINYDEDMMVILDNIQDPGNLGAILRTVDSVGITQIILSKNSVDAFNPKVIRSTMGAIFRVKVIESQNLVKTVEEIKKHEFEVMATSLEATENIYDEKLHKKAIIIGNEANGVSKELLDACDKKTKIPMLGKTESLNAAVATGIILYEYVRQKL